ncbi:MAG: alpha/beta fold hydrolase, partial [Microcystaceae cyanobacterium]
MYAEDFFSTAGEIEQIINLWSEYPFAPTPQGLYHHSQAILNSDTSARLGEIQCPTLVLAGRQDILAPIKHSEQLARGIANAELVVLDRGGHGLVIESPEAVVSILLKFLAQNA